MPDGTERRARCPSRAPRPPHAGRREARVCTRRDAGEGGQGKRTDRPSRRRDRAARRGYRTKTRMPRASRCRASQAARASRQAHDCRYAIGAGNRPDGRWSYRTGGCARAHHASRSRSRGMVHRGARTPRRCDQTSRRATGRTRPRRRGSGALSCRPCGPIPGHLARTVRRGRERRRVGRVRHSFPARSREVRHSDLLARMPLRRVDDPPPARTAGAVIEGTSGLCVERSDALARVHGKRETADLRPTTTPLPRCRHDERRRRSERIRFPIPAPGSELRETQTSGVSRADGGESPS